MRPLVEEAAAEESPASAERGQTAHQGASQGGLSYAVATDHTDDLRSD
jgi:hypothetical protein